MNLLALIPKYKFERGPTLVFACDVDGLRWLRGRFIELCNTTNGAKFVVGESLLITSDEKCHLVVTLAKGGSASTILRNDATHFTWSISREAAANAANMLETLITSNTPGHQYLTDSRGSYQTVVVIKNEEPIELIRAMRDGRPWKGGKF
jgi:hypothetical protein